MAVESVTVRMVSPEGGIANVPVDAVPVWEAQGWKVDAKAKPK